MSEMSKKSNLPDEKSHQNQERISVHAFKSSKALKEEIRKRINSRDKAHFKMDTMLTEGPYIYLVFKKRGE